MLKGYEELGIEILAQIERASFCVFILLDIVLI